MKKKKVGKKKSVSSRAPRRSKPPREKSQLKKKLLSLLFKNAFRYSKQSIFRLASGQSSPYYIDCKKVTLDPQGAYLVGELVFDRIKALKPKGIGGLTLGADPIAQAVCVVSHIRKRPIPAFIVRKKPKGYGSASGGGSFSSGWIEGNLPRNAKVVVVDDVITTGGSTLKAIDRLKAHGCSILKVVALVDRREGGTEAITSRGYTLETLFTLNDFLAIMNTRKRRGIV